MMSLNFVTAMLNLLLQLRVLIVNAEKDGRATLAVKTETTAHRIPVVTTANVLMLILPPLPGFSKIIVKYSGSTLQTSTKENDISATRNDNLIRKKNPCQYL